MNTGPVYGFHDNWPGLGVILDVADHTIHVTVNDRSFSFRKEEDHNNPKFVIGECPVTVLNETKTLLRVSYNRNTLALRVDVSVDGNGQWLECWHGSASLPRSGKLAISAAGGPDASNAILSSDLVTQFTINKFELSHEQRNLDEDPFLRLEDEKELLKLAESSADNDISSMLRATAHLYRSVSGLETALENEKEFQAQQFDQLLFVST